MKKSFESFQKSTYKSRKHSSYFQVYDEVLHRYVGKDIVFVEIGVLGGGSLFMWRDYFGSSARIIGIDLNENAKKWENEGFEIYIGNQSDKNFWEEFYSKVGKVDVLLDDGGHTYEQQSISTHYSIKNIKDGGVIIVEDTHTSYMSEFGRKKYSFMNLSFENVNKINRRFFGKSDKWGVGSCVWKIEFFESIVAYHIDREKCIIPNEIHNSGIEDDKALDYRYIDDFVGRRVSKLTRTIPKFIPHKMRSGLGDVILYLTNTMRTNKIKDFFK